MVLIYPFVLCILFFVVFVKNETFAYVLTHKNLYQTKSSIKNLNEESLIDVL